jgi:putative ATPase
VRACESKELYDVPINIRNAPTQLAKELDHGKGYAYDPSFQHPVANTFLPPELNEYSSFAPDVSKRFLQPEGSTHGKKWDETKLREWELARNGGRPWDGREERDGTGSLDR